MGSGAASARIRLQPRLPRQAPGFELLRRVRTCEPGGGKRFPRLSYVLYGPTAKQRGPSRFEARFVKCGCTYHEATGFHPPDDQSPSSQRHPGCLLATNSARFATLNEVTRSSSGHGGSSGFMSVGSGPGGYSIDGRVHGLTEEKRGGRLGPNGDADAMVREGASSPYRRERRKVPGEDFKMPVGEKAQIRRMTGPRIAEPKVSIVIPAKNEGRNLPDLACN